MAPLTVFVSDHICWWGFLALPCLPSSGTTLPHHKLKASSHRHARHDKTVLSVSRPLRRCELDFRDNSRLSPTENLSPNTFRAIVQFTSPRQTRHRQDCLVASGGRCESGIWLHLVIAKFHCTGPTGPARTFLRPGSPRNSVGSVRVSDKSPCGSGRARLVECSLYATSRRDCVQTATHIAGNAISRCTRSPNDNKAQSVRRQNISLHTHTHTRTRLAALCPGLPG